MTSKSGKAKGRLLQDEIRDRLRELGAVLGLHEDDIKSQLMGQRGVDVILSPACRKLAHLDLDIECKNREKMAIPATFWKHFKKYEKTPGLKLLFSKRNRQQSLVTMRTDDFFEILKKLAYFKPRTCEPLPMATVPEEYKGASSS